MDKNTLYEVLRADGAKLKAINFYTQEQLRDLYVERFGSEPDSFDEEINTYKLNESDEQSGAQQDSDNATPDEQESSPEEIRTVFFDCGFWCDELDRSFAPGYYRPSSVEEYLVLKKYAVREV